MVGRDEQQASGDQITGQESAPRDSAVRGAAGRGAAGRAAAGQESAGQEATGQATTGRESTVREPAGQEPRGQESAGQELGGREAGGWRPVSRARTYELVIERVEEQIISGALRVGDRLPPERDLAGMLGVSRAAVREAFRALEAQGVLRMSVGTGPDSGTTVAAMPSQALTRFLRLHVALANFPVHSVVEARVMLERESARHAAERAEPAELDELRQLLDLMADRELDRERFNELDTAFHVAIAEAGGNRLIADVAVAVRESVRPPLLEAFRELGESWAGVAEGLRREHEGILDALADRDPEVAERRMEDHIRGFYARIPRAVGVNIT